MKENEVYYTYQLLNRERYNYDLLWEDLEQCKAALADHQQELERMKNNATD